MLHHPKFEEARRLLAIPENSPNLASEADRLRAGLITLRSAAAAATAALIDLLDDLDGDPDLEPTLSATTDTNQLWGWTEHGGGVEDAEDEHDGAEPDPSGYGDQDGMSVEEVGEPSLGWTINGALGDRDDREYDGDDREPDSCDWPCLPDRLDQTERRAEEIVAAGVSWRANHG